MSRLTLGFLNYSSAKHLYKGKMRTDNEENEEASQLVQKKAAGNPVSLFDYFSLKPKINLYKLEEDKKRKSALFLCKYYQSIRQNDQKR